MGFSANHGAALVMILAIIALNQNLATSSSFPIEFSGDFFRIEHESECSGGSISECSVPDGVATTEEEFQMESEISRRMLAARRYISYGALRRNSVPCSRRGASYYNCRRGGQANPYSRGCSAITRCRR